MGARLIKEFRLQNRRLSQIFGFPTFVDNPMDMEYGPDGSLYVLEYGDGFFAENPDAQLSKINFVRGNRTPVVKAAAKPTFGRRAARGAVQQRRHQRPRRRPDLLRVGLRRQRHGRLHRGQPEAHLHQQRHLPRHAAGQDRTGRSAAAEALVLVGNKQPEVEFVAPTEDKPFQFGDTVTYEVKVTDDTPVDCSKVTVAFVLGHESHGHPQSSTAGCTGSIQTFVDGGHAGASNLSAVFVASYTDPGEGTTPGLTGRAEVRLVPAAAPTPTPTPPAP